ASGNRLALTLPCAREPSRPPPPCPRSVPSLPSCRGRFRLRDYYSHGPGPSGSSGQAAGPHFVDHVCPCPLKMLQGRNPCQCTSIDSRSEACPRLRQGGRESYTRAPPAATLPGQSVRSLRSHPRPPHH